MWQWVGSRRVVTARALDNFVSWFTKVKTTSNKYSLDNRQRWR